MSKKILVVEDETKIADMIKKYLEREMFAVDTAYDGKQGLEKALRDKPSLIILDLMLPEINGFEVCREIRKENKTPIIMLTAKTQEIDKLLGLELGADDYITKPFSLAELTARVKAVLRRTGEYEASTSNIISQGQIKLDLDKCELNLEDKQVLLTPMELNILAMLMRNPGRVYSRLQLLELALNESYEGYERSIDTHISNLRKKIEPDPSTPQHILTVYGIGYKFKEN